MNVHAAMVKLQEPQGCPLSSYPSQKVCQSRFCEAFGETNSSQKLNQHHSRRGQGENVKPLGNGKDVTARRNRQGCVWECVDRLTTSSCFNTEAKIEFFKKFHGGNHRLGRQSMSKSQDQARMNQAKGSVLSDRSCFRRWIAEQEEVEDTGKRLDLPKEMRWERSQNFIPRSLIDVFHFQAGEVR